MASYRRFAFWVLGYNLAVALWGALVRATGSGAGCGAHWPLCNGQVVPRSPAMETLIELTHRVMSGLAILLVAALVIAAFRALPRGHAGRRSAVAAAIFMVMEAAVGAALVLFGWVAKDASAARGGVVVVHLVNTFLLVGSIALTAALAQGTGRLTLHGRGPLAAAFGLAVATMLVSGATGAVAALGDTLFPAASVLSGLAQDLSEQAPFLLRLRVVHPFASLAAALVLVAVSRAAFRARDPRLQPLALRLLVLLGLQLLAGAANVALLAPVWLQLCHLALAYLTWIALVMLGAAALMEPQEGAGGLPAT
jgi:heme a synthase